MKKTLLFLISIFSFYFTFAQPCSKLFISEYVEGGFNNKALEIYNPTNKPIDLSKYKLSRYSNGSTAPNYVDMKGTINAYSAFVIVLDKQDCKMTGQDTCVFEALRKMADLFLCPVYEENKMMYFNGNDAVTLESNLGEILDLIGKVGENPGTAWTDSVEVGCLDPDGKWWWKDVTKDRTLIRKRTITEGVKANPKMFNPSIEWNYIAKNTFTNLKKHDCTCNQSTNVDQTPANNGAFVYPSLVRDNRFIVKASALISQVEVTNVLGQSFYKNSTGGVRGDHTVVLDNPVKGIYLVRITLIDKSLIVKKIMVQ